MARLVAIEWDLREARVVVARPRGKTAVFEHAFTVPLRGEDETDADTSTSRIGEKIGAALTARGVGRGEVSVAVGRTSIELRQLELPPSPPEELPDLVRFQALRQFANIGENWPLDFSYIDMADGNSLHVLAAAISPTAVEQIRSVCDAAGLKARRMPLRPFAAASLFRRRDAKRTDSCRLIVDPLAVEADLTMLVDEQVGFTRTVRLADAEYQTSSLVAEIRRTIVAAQNQLEGRRVERIVLCGGADELATLKEQLEKTLSLPVEVFDAFIEIERDAELARELPPHHGRFLPLLGVVLDEAAGAPHAIDFLNPTRPPAPPSVSRKLTFIGAAVAAVALLMLGAFLYQLASLQFREKELRAEINGMEAMLKAAEQRRKDVAAVEAFLAEDVTWIDELRELSLELPPAEDAIITQLSGTGQQVNDNRFGLLAGKLVIQGGATDFTHVQELEISLRDDRHKVIGTGSKREPQRTSYVWKIDETVSILAEDHSTRFDVPATSTNPGDEPSSAEPVERESGEKESGVATSVESSDRESSRNQGAASP